MFPGVFIDTFDGKTFIKRTNLTLTDLEEFPPPYIRFGRVELEYYYTRLPPAQPMPQYMLNLPVLQLKKDNFVGTNLKIHTNHQLSTAELYHYLGQLINDVFSRCSSITIRSIAIDEGTGTTQKFVLI